MFLILSGQVVSTMETEHLLPWCKCLINTHTPTVHLSFFKWHTVSLQVAHFPSRTFSVRPHTKTKTLGALCKEQLVSWSPTWVLLIEINQYSWVRSIDFNGFTLSKAQVSAIHGYVVREVRMGVWKGAELSTPVLHAECSSSNPHHLSRYCLKPRKKHWRSLQVAPKSDPIEVSL